VTKLLSGNRLQIYFAHSGSALSAGLAQGYLAMMPPGIRESIGRYRRWEDRQATLFGKLLLLRALRMTPHDGRLQDLQSLEFTPHGKPFIPGGPEFNISHSGEIVVLAVTRIGAVGIDVEKIHAVRIEDFTRYLPEVADLPGKYDAGQVNDLFFDCWTRKEAVLKGAGKGLLAPLEQVLIEENSARFCETTWHIRKLPLAQGYCCHVATDQSPGPVDVELVDLMNGNL
jgi:4'-phosphopantetheinyl transferase